MVTKDKDKEKEEGNNGGKNVLGIHFAPLSIPWDRRMETVAVFHFLSSFFLMGPGSLLSFLYVFFYTQYYYISLLYLAWYIYDRNICNQGGRRCEWMRRWKLWKHYCNYFPLRLVKTCDLDPKENYLFSSHPHGVLSNGAFGHFATDGSNFSQVFPNIKPHLLTLEGHFSFPLYREYLMLTGTCSASRASMNHILGHKEGGNAAVLVPGGPLESLDARPGKSTKLHMKNRKGFIKVAIQNGASLVPVYSFGENNIYDQVHNPEGSFIRRAQKRIQKTFGLAPVIFMGRGIFQYSFGLLPQRRLITTVVGKPIRAEKKLNPTQEEIDELHQKYISGLLDLFNTYKALYADKDEVLEII